MTRLVCITGPDGSGKSTQVDLLCEALRQQGQSVRPCTIWDVFSQPEGAMPFKSKREIDQYLGSLEPISRALFMFHALHEALQRALAEKPDVLVLNAYWYKYFSTERAYGTDADLLEGLTRVFPKPDLTFYLKVEPQTAASRKSRFSGYESGFKGDADSFLGLQKVAHHELDKLAIAESWHFLDAEQPVDVLAQAIRAEVTRSHHARLP